MPEKCRDCACDLFHIMYDEKAQARHVECANCGTVAGGLK